MKNKFKKKISFFTAILVLVLGLFLCGCELELEDEAGEENDAQATEKVVENKDEADNSNSSSSNAEYNFKYADRLTSHFEKHKSEFDYSTEEEYLAGANRVINSKDALTKTEAEDGDLIYYLEESNEIVFVSKDGYIRSYFKPSGGKKYFDKQ